MSDTTKRALWTAGQAFVSMFLLGAFGILQGIAESVSNGQVPDFGAAGSALIALAGAAGAAAFSVLKNALFKPGSSAR